MALLRDISRDVHLPCFLFPDYNPRRFPLLLNSLNRKPPYISICLPAIQHQESEEQLRTVVCPLLVSPKHSRRHHVLIFETLQQPSATADPMSRATTAANTSLPVVSLKRRHTLEVPTPVTPLLGRCTSAAVCTVAGGLQLSRRSLTRSDLGFTESVGLARTVV